MPRHATTATRTGCHRSTNIAQLSTLSCLCYFFACLHPTQCAMEGDLAWFHYHRLYIFTTVVSYIINYSCSELLSTHDAGGLLC